MEAARLERLIGKTLTAKKRNSIKTLSSRNFATNVKKSRKRSWRLEVAVNHQDFYTTNSGGLHLHSCLQCAIVNDSKFPVFPPEMESKASCVLVSSSNVAFNEIAVS